MQEYKSKIREEYGKEKKIQMFETMYSPLKNNRNILDRSHKFTDIKLNLRKEVPPAT